MKTVTGTPKMGTITKVASTPAPSIGAVKSGKLLPGTNKGAGASAKTPPKVKLPMHGGNFSHPKGSY